jgi:putative NIF3 family GTP cyclohydrolase 1 type 2
MNEYAPKSPAGRREFITTALKTASAMALVSGPLAGLGGYPSRAGKEYTVQEVIDIILKEIPGAPFSQTVDTIKSGNGGNRVSGIVTTMFATIDVIHATIKNGADFIIAHEPTFYNHPDNLNFVPGNEIVKEKLELLKQHNITVWRFHDYWHAYKPDGIGYGVLKKIGWLPYYQAGKQVLNIPEIVLKELLSRLKENLGIEYLRFIGDLNQRCGRIALLPGAAGGQRQISLVEREKPDVLIVGELSEWETAEYIRDARALGSKTALIVLGQSVSEEPGMEWLVEWLQPKTPGLKISHISSGNPFTWI